MPVVDAVSETAPQLGAYITQFVTLAVAVVALIGTYVGRKARTPADDQARAEFGYKVLKERYDESVADRKVLSDTVKYLQDQGRVDFKREQESEELVRKLNSRITQLSKQIEEYEVRMARLAEKVRMHQEITLHDIYGDVEGLPDAAHDLGNLEFTQAADEVRER